MVGKGRVQKQQVVEKRLEKREDENCRWWKSEWKREMIDGVYSRRVGTTGKSTETADDRKVGGERKSIETVEGRKVGKKER